ncbi:MAG: WYL domain-containing protein [Epsilonproteobacteria bacterium]|nr:WYL domain-containing protein [Campylobacterota bacterium]
MKEKKIINILKLLQDLKEGKKLCIEEYAKRLNISVRTMQRYKNEIEEFFEEKMISVGKGCYKFPYTEKINKILIDKEDIKDFEKFAALLAHLKPQMLKYLNIDEKIIKKIVPKDIVYVKDPVIEEFLNNEFFREIKKAIKYQQVMDIEYESDKRYFFENFKPYKIVFAEGNWYLCGTSDDEINNGFKFLRINFIKDIKVKPKSFKKDKKVEEFIYGFDSLMSRFNEPKKEAIVNVDKEVARFFKVKKFLPSQTILEENENGLKIRYYYTSDEEILFLAKRWLPHIKIITPTYLQDKLIETVKEFLK